MSHNIIKTDYLIEFSKILGQQTDYQEILRLVTNKVSQIFFADLTLILMLNPDTRETVKTIFKDGKNTAVNDGDDLSIIPAIAGGS